MQALVILEKWLMLCSGNIYKENKITKSECPIILLLLFFNYH